MAIIQKPSPNIRRGRGGYKPIAIVCHIMEGTLPGTDSWFDQTRSHVSAHYGVGKNGEIHQYVAESDTAFHVGVVDHPAWPLLKAGINPNLYTIGIEHEGRDGDALTPAQLHASAALIAAIAKRWKIPLDAQHIIRHHDIRRGKPCPGAGFDVAALITAAKGVSL